MKITTFCASAFALATVRASPVGAGGSPPFDALRAMKPLAARTTFLALITALSISNPVHAQAYKSSVVGTDFDFITEADPSTFERLEFQHEALSEMPDKTSSAPLLQQAFVFVSTFRDGTRVEIFIDADFETEAAAREEALRYTPRLGKLPTALRKGVERLVVHRGGENATAFSDVGLIVIYSDNATKRISTHDLEETVFHESVHAAWDKRHARADAWREAQRSDGTFLTKYARENPEGEDLAESALFAYTLLHHPERIPEADAARIRAAIPARIAFVAALIPPGEAVHHPVDRDEVDPRVEHVSCALDAKHLATARGISDILSNALNRGLDQDETAVGPWLSKAKYEHSTAEALIAAAARRFHLDERAVDAAVDEYLHCNCGHEALAVDPLREARSKRRTERSSEVDPRVEHVSCELDAKHLAKPRGISDILANALIRGLHQDETAVGPWISKAKYEHFTADALIAAAARRFRLDERAVDAAVDEYLHCNCGHEALAVDPLREARSKRRTEGGSAVDPRVEAVSCALDAKHLATARGISDILSNALNRGLDQDGTAVGSWLSKAKYEHSTADALIAAAASRFRLDERAVDAAVDEYLHCNCEHKALAVDPLREARSKRRTEGSSAVDEVADDDSPASAEAASPMASFARMVGGEWRMTALRGTSTFDTWHWGPGKHSTRVMTDGLDSNVVPQPWRELQVFYWHPGRKQVCKLGLSPYGRGVSEGTIQFDGATADGVFDLFQINGRRKMGLRWTFDGPDKYRDVLLEATGPDGLEPMNEWEHVRSNGPPAPRAPTAEKTPGPSAYLKVFESLLGHRWEAKGDWISGDALHVLSTFEYVPYADGIYARVIAPSKVGEPLHLLDAYVFHHTGTDKLRCLALSNSGSVHEGDVSVLEDGALQLALTSYEGDRVVQRVVRFDFEKDGALRNRAWSDEGTERTLVLDLRHSKLAPKKD